MYYSDIKKWSVLSTPPQIKRDKFSLKEIKIKTTTFQSLFGRRVWPNLVPK